ncbi:DNA gyrase subunit A [Alphaproteobacteria bacterium]|nr:DNA gyrase subunit A [Alphaproteobacteria bacterium]
MTEQTPNTPQDIASIDIETEMERSFLDYAMSVIVARALPDARDGLKPVHRRILYTMETKGFKRSFFKSARVVGDVMGHYHPHGDSAIYEAMARMAQHFSMRLMLVDGQGNFGSVDGDKPAAPRYTEVRMAKVADALVSDLDKDTVDFMPNYDESLTEPVVLPARFPNLLVNGGGGIAVGMATNIPSHNLGEILDACLAYADNPDITDEELLDLVPAPDFPTGGLILGRGGARQAYLTGRGSVIMRARTVIEELRKDRFAIVATEIPYQVNKSAMIERIAGLVKDKVIEGIAEMRDESDRHGIRVVYELKRDAQPDVVLNQLFKFSAMQTSFGVNMVALNHGKPELMTLRQIIRSFVEFREEVIRRRTIFELGKARDRAHVLVGLAIAVEHLDAIIELIKKSADKDAAQAALMARAWDASDAAEVVRLIDDHEYKLAGDGTYRLSEVQSKAILELQLHRLTGLERDKIHGELREISGEIKGYLETLRSRGLLYSIMKAEFAEIKEKYATPRLTEVAVGDFDQDDEDLIPREDMVITVSAGGYIKRVPLAAYRAQNRGGKGRSGMATKEEDFVAHLAVASTHTPLLFFSSLGKVYKLKTYRLPVASPQSQGRALINLLPLGQGEVISAVMACPEKPEDCQDLSIMFATASGNVRRNRMADFFSVQAGGKIAMKLDEGDRLIDVQPCTEAQDVLLAARGGKVVRFAVPEVRVFASRSSDGIRGIRLADGDSVVSMSIIDHVEFDTEKRDAYLKRRRSDPEAALPDGSTPDQVLSDEEYRRMAASDQLLLTITSEGMGKRSSAYEYRVSGRGVQGITNIDLPRGAQVVASFAVGDGDDVMLVSDSGQLIRLPAGQIRIVGRASKGVILFRTATGERVISAAKIQEAGADDSETPAEAETPAELQ